MLSNLGIKGRVLLLTLLPSGLFATALGGWFSYSQFTDLQQQLLQRGELILNQLSLLSEQPLQNEDIEQLSTIAQNAIELEDVRAIRFIAAPDRVLVHNGPSMRQAPLPDTQQLIVNNSQSSSQLITPIFRHSNTDDSAPIDESKPIGWISLELSHHASLLEGYRSIFITMLCVLFGLLITTLLALRLSRTINIPLENIKRGVARIRDGHLDTRLSSPGSHELDELVTGINLMAQTLQQAQEELQSNIDQALDDARHNMETIEIQNIELDLARKEAIEASRIKSEFLTSMSHEIRTPLNGIIGFTQLLKKSELSIRQQDCINTISLSAEKLLNIINDVLDFSKIEAGKLVLDHAPFYLRDLIQETLTLLAPSAHHKNLELISLVYRDTPHTLMGDALRIQQVLTNLVGNAIKFTRQGSVVVRAMLEEENEDLIQLRISVQDTGIGMHQSEQNGLFKAFSQIDHSLTRHNHGTGLGLAISKDLIEHMGGEIGVISNAGEGSEFWFSLPLEKIHSANLYDNESKAQTLPTLLYEPHPLARQAISHQLEDCGLQVTACNTLDELLEHLNSDTPYPLAVLSINTQQHTLSLVKSTLATLQKQLCEILLLSNTSDFIIFQDNLGLPFCEQILSKPVCHRRLKQAIDVLLPIEKASTTTLIAPLEPEKQHALQVLCVDDNPANLLLIKTFITDLGVDVSIADNGYTALELFQQKRFDIVFMDIQMPGMSGQQCTEKIRHWEQRQQQQATPIIAVTAHALEHETHLFLQSGLNDCLSKPISEQSIAQAIHKWTGIAVYQPNNLELSAAQLMEHQDLAIIDLQEGRALSNGKDSLANELLSLLLQALPSDLQFLNNARKQQDRSALLERIHRIHGATQYCGVPQLRAICKTCETLLKSNAAQTTLESALDQLEIAIERLLQHSSSTINPTADS